MCVQLHARLLQPCYAKFDAALIFGAVFGRCDGIPAEIEAALLQGCASNFQPDLCSNCSYITRSVFTMDAQVDHLEKLLQSKACAYKMTPLWRLAPRWAAPQLTGVLVTTAGPCATKSGRAGHRDDMLGAAEISSHLRHAAWIAHHSLKISVAMLTMSL